MSNINDIAKEFVEYYYRAFDSDRNNLAPLYVWECGSHTTTYSLPFQRVAHKVTTIDAQPSLPNVNAVVIAVTGQLLVDEETKPQQYTQLFQLVEENGFFIYNDIFRLNYA
ncbi:Nuclear transport factor 2 [Coemansia sp. RSA 2424]|nr:Nuclear transport factor 2 [Coemansia sp. RSA 2424]